MGQFLGRVCDEVVPGLWIGHVGCATDASMLQMRNITRIVDVSARNYTPANGVKLLRLPIPDVSDFDIRQIFNQTNAFIHQSLDIEKQNVLVHCAWGISRSASVVIAYLMAYRNLTLQQATDLVAQKRPIINPNPGFRKFLKLYEDELDTYRKTHGR
jgi:protein-tyrosine phosphatase